MVTKPTKIKKVTTKPAKTKAVGVKLAKTKKEKEIKIDVEADETAVVSEIKVEHDDQSEAKTRNGVEKYYEAIGRRKEATARVRLYTKKSTDEMPSDDKAIMTVNKKPYFEYFRAPELYMTADAPLRKLKSVNRFKASALVKGGGVRGQADAVRHGLARALVLFDQNFSKKLRKAGFLTRDARVKERRKYGLKKARKSPQWAKR
ncbi:MAG: 30S ribosomal protein S9 [Candidatus Yanofskybacteria bacterium]|nr:30S ribosomal protein S9 [Candidatus Yanofskybacteria bacterium]